MSDVLTSGRLEDHPFAVLAGFAFREGRSGELTLERGHRRLRVWFLGGNPVAVLSDDPQDHIAQVLLEHGRIGDEDAARLAALPETREAMAAADFVPREVLNWGVKYRFVNLCYDLFRWEEGDYRFREDAPPRDLFLLKVPAHTLLLKGVAHLPKGGLLDRVPDGAALSAGPVAAADARYLGPEERRLLEECRPGRTVGDVLGGGWDDVDQVRRLIYAFSCLGLVGLGPAEPPAVFEPEPEPAFALEEPQGMGEEAEPLVAPVASPAEQPPAAPAPAEIGARAAGVPEEGEASRGFDYDAVYQPPVPQYTFDEERSGGSLRASFPSELPVEEPFRGGADASRARARAEREGALRGRASRLARVAALAVGAAVAVAAVGSGIWWWMGTSEEPLPAVIPPMKRVPPPVQPVAPPAPERQPSAPPPSPPTAAAPVAPSPPTAAAPAAPAAAPAAPAVSPPAPQSARPGSDRYRNGLSVMNAGDFDGAAAIWESELAEGHRGEFTLLMMTACERDTVRAAFRALAPLGPVFLVTRQVQGRSCYRVCLGTFPSRDAAGRALAEVPAEFRAAGAGPRAVADVLDRSR